MCENHLPVSFWLFAVQQNLLIQMLQDGSKLSLKFQCHEDPSRLHSLLGCFHPMPFCNYILFWEVCSTPMPALSISLSLSARGIRGIFSAHLYNSTAMYVQLFQVEDPFFHNRSGECWHYQICFSWLDLQIPVTCSFVHTVL